MCTAGARSDCGCSGRRDGGWRVAAIDEITVLMRLRPAVDIGRVFLRRGPREQMSEDSLLYHGSQHARVERGLGRFHMKFLDSLLSALHGIERSNRDIRDAIRANTEAYKQQQQMPGSSGTTVQLQLPEAIATYYEPERSGTQRCETISGRPLRGSLSYPPLCCQYSPHSSLTERCTKSRGRRMLWKRILDLG
jgi:hypothetical protein